MPGQIKSAGAASAAGEVGLVCTFDVPSNLGRCPGRLSETFKQLVSAFRPLGNLQRRVLTLPRRRKRSAACFDAFRGLGNVQRRVLMLSEASETFSGVFWRFPRRRKPSAARFDAFRGLGAASAAGEVGLVRTFEVSGQLPSPGRGRATVCLQLPLATRELTTAKPPSLQRVRRSGASFSKQLPRPL